MYRLHVFALCLHGVKTHPFSFQIYVRIDLLQHVSLLARDTGQTEAHSTRELRTRRVRCGVNGDIKCLSSWQEVSPSRGVTSCIDVTRSFFPEFIFVKWSQMKLLRTLISNHAQTNSGIVRASTSHYSNNIFVNTSHAYRKIYHYI